VRRIGLHAAPFAQRFEYQCDIAVLQVTHPSVHQFRTPARSALCEIILFEQRYAVTAQYRIYRAPQSGGAAPDDYHIPYPAFIGQQFQALFPLHIIIFRFSSFVYHQNH